MSSELSTNIKQSEKHYINLPWITICSLFKQVTTSAVRDHVHTSSSGSNATPRSGLVCWYPGSSGKEYVVIHHSKETGGVSLPQAPCQRLPQDQQLEGERTFESFGNTAKRIAKHQLGHNGNLAHYSSHVSDSSGPTTWFRKDTRTSSTSGVTEETAWFLADIDMCKDNLKLDTAGCGENWIAEDMLVEKAIEKLPKHEVKILKEAMNFLQGRLVD